MAGRTLPQLKPREYEPGLIDAGGLPVRVRHIFDRYRQYMGDSMGTTFEGYVARSTIPLNSRFDGAEAAERRGVMQRRITNRFDAAAHAAKTEAGAADYSHTPQKPHPQMAFSVTGDGGYAMDSVDMDGMPAVVVEESKPLVIESYTGVIEPRKEQEFAMVLLSRSLPAAALIFYVDGKIPCKAFLVGRTLRATLPPLKPGRHSLAIRDTNGGAHFIYMGGFPGNKSLIQQAITLPLLAVPYPASRRQPRLCYSTNGQRRIAETPDASAMPNGPYTAAELDAFVAATKRQMQEPNGTLVPFSKVPGRDGSAEKANTFDVRLRKCLQMAYGQMPHSRSSDCTPAFVPDDLSDCRVPLAFKTSLFSSCQPSTRNAIAYFHSQLFEFMPFGVVSAHIFTKSHFTDKITIFAFTLTPPDSKDRTVPPGSSPANVASLDRFEVSERLCADTRHWKYTDTCVPRKNSEAEAYQFGTSSGAQCPVPQSLRHSMNPYKDYPEGLEIAPFVYLYFEPWPEQELPMPQPKAPTEKLETGSGGSSSLAVRAVGDRKPKTQSAESSAEQRSASGPYFSVTLCVGKYIFSSILGVHIRVLSSIFNDWLRAVPLKEQEAGKLVRLRLTDVAPIASTQPVADRAL